MVEIHFESALAHHTDLSNTSINLREIADRGMIDLRGSASDRKFMTAVKKVLGVDAPKAPRSSSAWGEIKCLWLSIDQWLILCPRAKADALVSELNEALNGLHSLVVNVSDMRAIIRLEGDGCRETLMKGTSLDLLNGSYAPGAVRRMRFAEIAALLHIVEHNVIDVYVFRSYADYTWEFLLKAARKGSEVILFEQKQLAVNEI
jgi:sarcosine oxidase, subunit gamma